MELQLYINNISICLVIVNLLSARIKNYQWYTIIKYGTTFTSQLSTNYNYILRDSVILSNSEQYILPTKNILLIMSTSTNILSGSNDNINISTESTIIPDSHFSFLSKYLLDSTIQAMFDQSKEQFWQTRRRTWW